MRLSLYLFEIHENTFYPRKSIIYQLLTDLYMNSPWMEWRLYLQETYHLLIISNEFINLIGVKKIKGVIILHYMVWILFKKRIKTTERCELLIDLVGDQIGPNKEIKRYQNATNGMLHTFISTSFHLTESTCI